MRSPAGGGSVSRSAGVWPATVPTMRLTPGMWISPTVRLVRPLSSGGGGTLWVAAHMRMHTQVAVKFLAGHLMSDPKSRARFLREARLASEIDSPHLVHTYDTGLLADETPYIVMEWLEGESLKQRIKRESRLHPAGAASLGAQVAKALSRTHEAGVGHCDSPSPWAPHSPSPAGTGVSASPRPWTGPPARPPI